MAKLSKASHIVLVPFMLLTSTVDCHDSSPKEFHPALSRDNRRFRIGNKQPKIRQWHPQLQEVLNKTLHQDCCREYDFYVNGDATAGGLGASSVRPAVSCIVDNVNGIRDANMQAAGVLLGILPTVLALAGSSTTETGVLALRRPLLAFLLGAGSPAVAPIRAFDYKSPAELLQARYGARQIPERIKQWKVVVSVAQYILAMGAIVNLAVAPYKLGIRTIASCCQETSCTPLLWAFLAIPVHLFGASAVYLRVRIEVECSVHKVASGGTLRKYLQRVRSYISQECRLTCAQNGATIVLQEETDGFLALSWIAPTATVIHIAAGTMIFSSTLFIGSTDARNLGFQLLVSTLVCRMILAFEFCGMRQVLKFEEVEQPNSGKEEMSLSSEGMAGNRVGA